MSKAIMLNPPGGGGGTHKRYKYTGNTLGFVRQCCEWADTLGITGDKLLLLDPKTSSTGNNRCAGFLFINGVGIRTGRYNLSDPPTDFPSKIFSALSYDWSLTGTTGCNIVDGSEFVEFDISEVFDELL